VRLEFFDDLHRAQLRRTGDRASGKAGAQQVDRIMPLGQIAGHLAHQVVDMGEALDLEQSGYPDAAHLAATTQVVTQQIDDHHILGAILGTGGERRSRCGVVPRIERPRSRALDRTRLHMSVAHLQEAFGRHAGHLPERQVEPGAERRGRATAQREVGGQRVAVELRTESLRQIDLIDIALPYVSGDALERFGIASSVQVGNQPGQPRLGCAMGGKRRTQPLGERVELAGRERLRVATAQPARALKVIGHQRPAINAHGHLRPAAIVFCTRLQPLDPAAEVIAEVADRATGKGQSGRGGGRRDATSGQFPTHQ